MSISDTINTATTGLLNSARIVHESANRITRNGGVTDSAPPSPASAVTSQGGDINSTPGLTQGQDVSLESNIIRDVVRINQAETVYQASATLIRTADEMSEALLDVEA